MAQPKSLELNGDYGCTSKEVQYMRVELLRRVLMTNDENTKQKMSEQIVQLSQKQCLPLNGKYRVISRTKDMAEVDVNNQRFWVLQ